MTGRAHDWGHTFICDKSLFSIAISHCHKGLKGGVCLCYLHHAAARRVVDRLYEKQQSQELKMGLSREGASGRSQWRIFDDSSGVITCNLNGREAKGTVQTSKIGESIVLTKRAVCRDEVRCR